MSRPVFGYATDEDVFVLDPKTKHWLQGIIKEYIPEYRRSYSQQAEPAYSVSIKRLRVFKKDGNKRHKLVWGRPLIATNGYIKPIDLEPKFETGQKVRILRNGQKVIILQLLDRPTKLPTYLVFNIDENRKHMIGEAKIG